MTVEVIAKKSCIVLLGNPNVGKTTLFNSLTGLHQKTGNFSGVTVEKKIGELDIEGQKIEIIDLPGTYSLAANSPDEMIAADVLLGQQQETELPDLVIAVVDSSNIERNLYLITQVLECEIPVIITLNMYDLAQKRGLKIDSKKLAQKLSCPVIPVVANRNQGIEELRATIEKMLENSNAPKFKVKMSEKVEQAIASVSDYLQQQKETLGRNVHRVEIQRILFDQKGEARRRIEDKLGEEFCRIRQQAIKNVVEVEEEIVIVEPEARYGFIGQVVSECVEYNEPENYRKFSDKVDAVLTHPISGLVVFVMLMALIFQSIYAWAGPIMDIIDGVFGILGTWIGSAMGEGILQSLIVDGIIAGVGAVLIFLPQILILFAFIAILEDCGYMARAAFLMDRIMRWAGLSGHSFVPMLSSFACAIPGVMSTRSIENRRDRFTTILIAPLMSCSARLPVYTIMITAFIPSITYLNGWINLKGLTLFAMYSLGIVLAIPIAWILKKTLLKGDIPPFVMEMPTYKFPDWRTVLLRMYTNGTHFIMRAGTVIFAVTIIVWALAYFPRSQSIEQKYQAEAQKIEQEYKAKITGKSKEEITRLQKKREEALRIIEQSKSGEQMRNSFLGRSGKLIEPIVAPLGWDWKIGIGALASFPAREVIIATLGIIYNMGQETDEESEGLRNALKNDKRADGTPVFTPLVALSIMVFFALCCQCGATLAVIWRETGSWIWPLFTFSYMTTLAYIASLITYQGGKMLGFN